MYAVGVKYRRQDCVVIHVIDVNINEEGKQIY